MDHATGFGPLEEFAASPEEIALGKKYGDEAEDLMTALHEVIGHGSGKLNPKLTHEPSYYLKEYYSTLEEARADLMALWNAFDPKLQELGLISSPDVAKAMYNARGEGGPDTTAAHSEGRHASKRTISATAS